MAKLERKDRKFKFETLHLPLPLASIFLAALLDCSKTIILYLFVFTNSFIHASPLAPAPIITIVSIFIPHLLIHYT